ncbi:MAG: amidohydrolase family protein [Alphaproteobacteria bacterium]|nr:amidohydrolase family protein [Alphaproteobacteria bacterium]
MIIDAHQHFWDPGRGDYGWLRPDMALHRVYLPADIEPLLRANGVDGTILVQAAPTAAETDYLLGIAQHTSWVKAVVGWVALDTPQAPDEIARLARMDGFAGLRPMLQDIEDPRWILRDENAAGLEAVGANDLVFDALIRADQLAVLDALLTGHPDLTVVLDHAAKPPFGDSRGLKAWACDIARAARHANLHCKVSGLLTELPKTGEQRLVTDCINRLLDLFGPERLIWGTDWPVLTLAGSYAPWKRMVAEILAVHPQSVCDAVMGGNACRVYRLS